MGVISAFLPGFHRQGLGKKPLASQAKVLKQIRAVDAVCLAHLELLLGSFLPTWLLKFRPSKGKCSRRRSFTPVLTFWAFLAQIIDVGSSCRSAVSKVQALCVSKKLLPPSSSTAAYCRARARLGARLLIRILRHTAEVVQRAAGQFDSSAGRLLVIDGTSFTMPDSILNQEQYSYPPGQKEGCGFPVMDALGLFDLRTGACLRLIKSNQPRHDSALAWKMLGFLRKGDVLVADRAFCSYAFIAELQRKGVAVVMRLHQRRKAGADMTKGKPLGPGDRLHLWSKPKQRPKGVHPFRFAAVEETLQVRVVEHSVAMRGHRPEPMWFATTLLDPAQHTAAAIAELYLRRWDVELFFDDIKTSQGMDTLRCESPHMIARELLMHMIVYNLVRLLMFQADGQRPARQAGRLSFKGTLDRLNQWHCALWGCQSQHLAKQQRVHLIDSIAEDVVPDRPGRREPRVVKRRPRSYKLMTKPRNVLRTQPEPPKRSKYRAA